jgi:uncharacterized membrane protein YhaH (DUF805 family)
MFKTLWGEVKNGRLQRLPYLGYFVLLNVLLGVLVFGVLMSLDVEEGMLNGDLEQVQAGFAEHLSMPVVLLGAVVLLLVLFASLNIMAKRLRDTGLPGWWSTLGVVAIGAMLSQIVSEQVGSGFHSLVMLALILIPTASFNKQQNQLLG